VERVLWSYWCILHEAVPEPVFLARLAMMQFYGDRNAVEAMLARLPEPEEENNDDAVSEGYAPRRSEG
jgi:hypothetical protein